jgi:hypothetical protein
MPLNITLDHERQVRLIAELEARVASLTAAHAMQDESLVVLPRHMMNGIEEKLKAQAAEIAAQNKLLDNARIALAFHRYWMYEKAETRYPFGHEIESEIASKLTAASLEG